MSHKFHRPSKKVSKPSFVSYLGKGQKDDGASSDGGGQAPGQFLSPPTAEGLSASRGSLTGEDDRASMASLPGTLTRETLVLPDDVFQNLVPTYVPGEMPLANAARVMRYIPYSDCKQGTMGCLYVTNYRIMFLPVKNNSAIVSPGSVENHSSVWKNKLYGDDDILFNNVDAAYQVSRGRRKRLVAGKHSDRTVLKKIEIHCKNFRIHQFSLECCSREDANKLADSIAHFSFPDKVDRHFAFSYKGDTSPDPESNISNFLLRSTWEKELARLRAKHFKVTECNEEFRDSMFMPKYFVVPHAYSNDTIRKAFNCFEDYRFPVWSYSHANGSSLLRMTFTLATHINPQDEENRYLGYIKQIHPEQKQPLVYDVHEPFPAVFSRPEYDEKLKLPGVKDVRNSYDKLKEICMSVTVKELESSDSSWLGTVDNTKWLAHVSSCLKVADRMTQILAGTMYDLDKKYRRVSIVIKEHDGAKDMTPLVTSLVQILMDPHSRTTDGFQALVEREWVAFGHQFKDRYGVVSKPDQEEQCPIFLLFLDCVWQLLRQQPESFEYTEVYLVTLWESVCSGLFGNFLFNSQREMISELDQRDNVHDSDRFTKLGSKKITENLLSVWDWTKQYSSEVLALLKNPIYTMKALNNGNLSLPRGKEPVRRIRILSKYYKEKPTDAFIDLDLEDDSSPQEFQIISPQISTYQLSFWTSCYLRWMTPVQIVGGGSAIECIFQNMISDEIREIQEKINMLDSEKSTDVNGAQVVNNHVPKLPSRSVGSSVKRRLLEGMTSSFPYAPSRPTAQISFFGAQSRNLPEEFTSSCELEASTSSTADLADS